MSINLKLDRALHETHRVQVLQLDLRPKLLLTNTPDGNIRLATQVSLLHVGFRSADPLQRASHVIDVVVSFPRRTKVRFSNDLRQRSAPAIQIDVGITIDVRQTRSEERR